MREGVGVRLLPFTHKAKRQHWCGLQAENGWKGSPVLECRRLSIIKLRRSVPEANCEVPSFPPVRKWRLLRRRSKPPASSHKSTNPAGRTNSFYGITNPDRAFTADTSDEVIAPLTFRSNL